MALVIVLCLLVITTQTVVWCDVPANLDMRHASYGDYIIGGMYPFRFSGSDGLCSSAPGKWALSMSQTMIFAIQEINSNPAILPDCIIGYDIRDTCWSEEFTLYTSTALAVGRNSRYDTQTNAIPVGLIGPASSVNAIYAGKVAGLYQIPIISYSATSNELSNKERFPYFLRTVPPDKLQARAMVDILLHYDWRYVGLLYSADTYGIHGALEVTKLAEQNDICIAFSVVVREEPQTNEINDIVSRVGLYPKATVFVIFSLGGHMYDILRAVHATYPNRRLICIGSDGFSGYGFLRNPSLANATTGSFYVGLTYNKVPNVENCMMLEAMISSSFTLIYAPTLLKVNRIFRIFQSSRRSVRRPRFVGPKQQLMLAFVFILIQVLVSVISVSFAPALPTFLFPPDLRKYVEIYCSFGQGFVATIVYNMIIILVCCFYAFKTRKVPSNYNESKFIAISVYSTLVLFLAVIPVYTTALHVLQKVATLSAALQLNASLTLALVYLPKLYGIHFADELNVQEWRTTANQIGSISGIMSRMKTDSAMQSKKSDPI
ncbi:metabotropic glutamate receptor 3-like [Acanthaster planci]|uniref:Metabotropic glutamate receptor 3-like n=1 Tax=Acanthaster planci TaxID=133434 RepID=A0A8B7YHQ4_ACAPL|nr:metabotropic glutamate receptor 3-like [Acanthaster planci]